jgi:hypothetical protein
MRSDDTSKGDQMREEYDFSEAERGEFFNPGAQYNPPL